jgi:hypothetical protein
MPNLADMGAGHFIYIPAILLIGIVIGWILGSRAAADAYAAELKRREERAARRESTTRGTTGGLDPASS